LALPLLLLKAHLTLHFPVVLLRKPALHLALPMILPLKRNQIRMVALPLAAVSTSFFLRFSVFFIVYH
jgi:hypothetical protein